MGKTTIGWISNLRALSTLAVVILHVSVPYAAEMNFHPGDRSWWIIGNLVDGAVRFCVPVFVMISGVVWLRDTTPALVFYKKKVMRLIGPFLFWSLANYFFNMFYMKTQSSDVHVFEDFMERLRVSNISAHFWYVYMLIGLFLLAPVFKVWVQNASARDVLVFIVVWAIILTYQLPMFNTTRTAIDIHQFGGYIGYLVLGYYLANHVHASVRGQKIAGIILLIIGVATTVIGTHILSVQAQRFEVLLYEYLTPNVLMASIGVFLLGKNIKIENSFIVRMRDSVAEHGYGIYLSHIMAIFLFIKDFNAADYHPLVYIPVISLAGFVVSWLFIFLANKVPYARYVLG